MPLVDESFCLNNEHGFLSVNYNDHIAKTASGKICNNWLDMYRNGQTKYPYPDDIAGSRNYCRATTKELDENNKVDKGAWCWVSDTEWEYCTCNTGTCANNVHGNLPVGYQDPNSKYVVLL